MPVPPPPPPALLGAAFVVWLRFGGTLLELIAVGAATDDNDLLKESCGLLWFGTAEATGTVLPDIGLSFPVLLKAFDRVLFTSLAVGAKESVTGLEDITLFTALFPVLWGSCCGTEAEPNSTPL